MAVPEQMGGRLPRPGEVVLDHAVALIPRGGLSTKTTGVRESQGFRYDWSREIGVAIRPANRLPSRASSPGRSPAPS